MQVTNKLTAVCTAVIVALTSLTTVSERRIIANAETNTLEAMLLSKPISPIEPEMIEELPVIVEEDIIPVDDIIETEEIIEEKTEEITDEFIFNVSEEDIELLALVTMAEAEAECEEGKRLVIDTILNRVDSERFDNTISEVIYAPNQFTSMHNGRIEKCYVSDNIYQLVIEELQNRTNYEVLYFTADYYGTYGTPMFGIENHYFSK